jgi:hypothetical protein
MLHPKYTLFGLLSIATATWAEYRGWTFTSVDENKNVPKSIRDNPGSYRAFYAARPRIFGGK